MLFIKFTNFLKFERGYSHHTVRAYLNDIETFYDFLNFRSEQTNLISSKHVRAWIIDLKSRNRSSKTINRKISSLKTFFLFCEREEFININPILKIQSLKQEKRLPVVVSEFSLEKLLNSNDFFKDSFKGSRDRLIIEVFYQTGVRLGELISIKILDFDIQNQELKVLGKRNKERIVPLTSFIITLFKSYLKYRNQSYSDCSYLFVTESGKKTYPKMIYRIVNFYLSKVSSVQKISPHVLRHAFATHLLNRGADLNAIKDLLGHNSLLSTQVYTSVSSDKITKTYNKSHPRGE